MSRAVVIFISSICAADKTSTTIGTSCALASVFVAVTITSSIPSESWANKLNGINIAAIHKLVCNKFFINVSPLKTIKIFLIN